MKVLMYRIAMTRQIADIPPPFPGVVVFDRIPFTVIWEVSEGGRRVARRSSRDRGL
jgi:hypothetical protein